MSDSNEIDQHLSKVRNFYNGKSIFLTGAAGFVGSVLLEALLRCCPGIKSIYILLRTRRNVQAEDRKNQIFDKKLFEKLKAETPEAVEKVHVIPGDISLPKLGISEEDIQLLVDEVSIVFHVAAILNFLMPLEIILVNNVLSLDSVIVLCKQMKKFEALVYTSTCYSNGNHINFTMKEEIYRLPFNAEKFLDALKNKDSEKLEELVGHCKPDWPNTYTFSKCLAENLLSDTASDLPVVIIRPSIVMSTWKSPIPGYAEENSGLATLGMGVGKGFIKALLADPNVKMNIVPADIVANAHIIAAWSIGTKRCTSPLVVNCTATDNLRVKMKDFCEVTGKMVSEFPFPKSFELYKQPTVISYKPLYYIVAAYHHYLPAIVLDGILKTLGKKPRIFSLYRFLDKVMGSLNFFVFNPAEFERNNMDFLDKMIDSEDKKDFGLDFRAASMTEMTLDIPKASRFFDWKIDKRSKSERESIKNKRHILIVSIQWTFLLICCLLIYGAYSVVFR